MSNWTTMTIENGIETIFSIEGGKRCPVTEDNFLSFAAGACIGLKIKDQTVIVTFRDDYTYIKETLRIGNVDTEDDDVLMGIEHVVEDENIQDLLRSNSRCNIELAILLLSAM